MIISEITLICLVGAVISLGLLFSDKVESGINPMHWVVLALLAEGIQFIVYAISVLIG